MSTANDVYVSGQGVLFDQLPPEFLLGNQLAKTMLRALFRKIVTRVPDIHVTAEPELLSTNFIRGVKRAQVAFTPE